MKRCELGSQVIFLHHKYGHICDSDGVSRKDDGIGIGKTIFPRLSLPGTGNRDRGKCSQSQAQRDAPQGRAAHIYFAASAAVFF